MLVPSTSPTPVLGKTLVIGGLAASLVAITGSSAALATHTPRAATIDPCAVTFDMPSLSQRDRALVARRSLACSDVEHGRITQAEYQQQVAAIDTAWTSPVVVPAPAIQWASTVRGFSSQYTTTSWAADRVLGAPDVFPTHGDNANAWASLGADDRDEWLEVGYAQPTRISAIDVFETYNPGAISAVEMITASGEHLTAYQASPHANGAVNKLHVDVGCTAEPIVAVYVRVASRQVAGWNEIDAVGVSPCVQ
jgi:hypothetical protein